MFSCTLDPGESTHDQIQIRSNSSFINSDVDLIVVKYRSYWVLFEEHIYVSEVSHACHLRGSFVHVISFINVYLVLELHHVGPSMVLEYR
jgi:hypothetical protein